METTFWGCSNICLPCMTMNNSFCLVISNVKSGSYRWKVEKKIINSHQTKKFAKDFGRFFFFLLVSCSLLLLGCCPCVNEGLICPLPTLLCGSCQRPLLTHCQGSLIVLQGCLPDLISRFAWLCVFTEAMNEY